MTRPSALTQTDAVQMAAPESDGYRTVATGPECPRCGKPGFPRVKSFGVLTETLFVHSQIGRSVGGCMVKEQITSRGETRTFSEWRDGKKVI